MMATLALLGVFVGGACIGYMAHVVFVEMPREPEPLKSFVIDASYFPYLALDRQKAMWQAICDRRAIDELVGSETAEEA